MQWNQPVVLCDLLSVFDEKKSEAAPDAIDPSKTIPKKKNSVQIMAELKAKLSTKLVFVPAQTKRQNVTCVEKIVTNTKLPEIPLS